MRSASTGHRGRSHDVNNPNSGGVMKKCGMQFEGIMREGAKNNGGLCDIANYAILKKDRA